MWTTKLTFLSLRIVENVTTLGRLELKTKIPKNKIEILNFVLVSNFP